MPSLAGERFTQPDPATFALVTGASRSISGTAARKVESPLRFAQPFHDLRDHHRIMRVCAA